MDNLRVLIIEDNHSAALDEEILITEMGYELVGIIDNGEEALLKIVSLSPDLILMDIQLKGKLTGLDVAKHIKHLDIPIIFTTSFNDQETYNQTKTTNSYGYLVKPFNKLSLQSAIEMTVQSLAKKEKRRKGKDTWEEDVLFRDYFMIKHKNILQKVKISDIIYLQGEGNYCTLFTDKKRFVVKMSMKKIMERLEPHSFIPVHKSYLVQLEKIESIDTLGNRVKIENEDIPLGRTYKSNLLKHFEMLK